MDHTEATASVTSGDTLHQTRDRPTTAQTGTGSFRAGNLVAHAEWYHIWALGQLELKPIR